VNVATYNQRQTGVAYICEKDEPSVSIEDILPWAEKKYHLLKTTLVF